MNIILLYSYLSHPLTDVLEESMPGVLALVGVDNPVAVQVPDLDVAIRRSSAEQGLVDVHADTLDGMVVGLMEIMMIMIQSFN